MSFKKNKYVVIKKAISSELAKFVSDYFLLKRKVTRRFFDDRYISQFTEEWGVWNDQQVPETYSHYADIAMETLLQKVLPVMEKHTGYQLYPTYSYARIYKKGDVLKRHKDRFSCEVSCTLNLGGDKWPIFLEAKKNVGKPDNKKYFAESNNKGTSLLLNPGDCLAYHGELLEHWREAFQGEDCIQVFLHYNRKNALGAEENQFDKRPHLGLPAWFKK
jgi:hypothetical protein